MSLAEIADWAVSSPLIDGVIFVPAGNGGVTVPVRAVAVARGFQGYGKGLTQSAAMASAIGEALEQFAASRVCQTPLIEASFNQLADKAFDPRWLCLYRLDQYRRPGFPYQPFDPNRPLRWVLGHWLDDGQEVYLPAFAVFLSQEFVSESLCQMTSNGLAAGESVSSAVRSAVFELHERDSFLSSWIAQCNVVRVPMNDPDPDVAEMLSQCERQGATIEIYLVAQGDPAYVAVCVGLGEGDRWPAVTLGLGAGNELRQAVMRAVLEHGQTGPFLADEWRLKPREISVTHQDVLNLQDQALYYCDPLHFGEFEKWRSGSRRINPTPRSDNDVRIAVVDLTPPELEDSPYRVVRAVARGLQPVSAGHGFERSHTKRLQTLLKGRQPNPAPVPFC